MFPLCAQECTVSALLCCEFSLCIQHLFRLVRLQFYHKACKSRAALLEGSHVPFEIPRIVAASSTPPVVLLHS
jgi:hypothetical protein